jgi:hypothetical protein
MGHLIPQVHLVVWEIRFLWLSSIYLGRWGCLVCVVFPANCPWVSLANRCPEARTRSGWKLRKED